MSFTKNTLACLTLALAISACEDGKGPGNPDAYQGKEGANGNECSQQFVAEYNEVARAARYVQSDLQLTDTTTNRAQLKSDAQALKDKATAFRSKYAGVSCVALLNDSRQSLDVNSRMDQAIKAADAALSLANQPANNSDNTRDARDRVGTSTGRVTPPTPSGPPASTGPEQCSSTLLRDFLVVTDAAKVLSDDLKLPDTPATRELTKADARKLKEEAQAFQTRYAGKKCQFGSGTSRTTIDVDAKMSEIISLADQVIDALNKGSPVPNAAHALLRGEAALEPIQAISR